MKERTEWRSLQNSKLGLSATNQLYCGQPGSQLQPIPSHGISSQLRTDITVDDDNKFSWQWRRLLFIAHHISQFKTAIQFQGSPPRGVGPRSSRNRRHAHHIISSFSAYPSATKLYGKYGHFSSHHRWQQHPIRLGRWVSGGSIRMRSIHFIVHGSPGKIIQYCHANNNIIFGRSRGDQRPYPLNPFPEYCPQYNILVSCGVKLRRFSLSVHIIVFMYSSLLLSSLTFSRTSEYHHTRTLGGINYTQSPFKYIITGNVT